MQHVYMTMSRPVTIKRQESSLTTRLRYITSAHPHPRHAVLPLRPGATECFDVAGITIRLDGWWHASGLHRAYIHCRIVDIHGPYCFKYRQLNQFVSKRRAVAFLYAWTNNDSDEVTTERHRQYVPSAQDVDAAEHVEAVAGVA